MLLLLAIVSLILVFWFERKKKEKLMISCLSLFFLISLFTTWMWYKDVNTTEASINQEIAILENENKKIDEEIEMVIKYATNPVGKANMIAGRMVEKAENRKKITELEQKKIEIGQNRNSQWLYFNLK